MSGFVTVLAWFGLVVGLGGALLIVALLDRVLKPLLEIRRYADAILEAVRGTERNLGGADELVRTRELLRRLGAPVS